MLRFGVLVLNMIVNSPINSIFCQAPLALAAFGSMRQVSLLLAGTRHLCRVLSTDILHLLRWPFVPCRRLIARVTSALVGGGAQRCLYSGSQPGGVGATVHFVGPVLLRRGKERCPGQEQVDDTF